MLVLLSGELGSGKTTLTKGIVAGLGAATEDEVTSPTFTLLHEYGSGHKVYHGDLYRIENFHDFETLGLEDAFTEPGIIILEWSENFPLKAPWPVVRLQAGTSAGGFAEDNYPLGSRQYLRLNPACPQ